MTLGDRVAVMKDGVVQQLDTPQALYRDPANLFVAAFIGSPSMNLIEAQIDGGDGAASAVQRCRCRRAATCAPTRAGRVVLGMRPADFEDAALARDEAPADAATCGPTWSRSWAPRSTSSSRSTSPPVDDRVGARAWPSTEGGDAAMIPLVADAGETICTARVRRPQPLRGGRDGAAGDRHRPLPLLRPESGEAIATPQGAAQPAWAGCRPAARQAARRRSGSRRRSGCGCSCACPTAGRASRAACARTRRPTGRAADRACPRPAAAAGLGSSRGRAPTPAPSSSRNSVRVSSASSAVQQRSVQVGIDHQTRHLHPLADRRRRAARPPAGRRPCTRATSSLMPNGLAR